MVNFFIHRPIFASSIAIIMVLAGTICYFLLPVSQFPDITPPQVVVSANYPGASAQVVADTVTTPLEQQINGVQGMTYMSSSSSNDGSSTITVTFEVGYPLSTAAVDVQNRVSQAASSLPAIVNQGGVTIKKQNPNFVLIVNLTSPDGSVDPVALSNLAYLQVVDPLKRLPGVGDVQIFGERRYSMRVWLDPDKLANLGITAVDVQNAIAEQNVQVAAGKIGQSPAPAGTAFEMQVNAVGRLSDPKEFGDIIVRADAANGSLVRLRDVARIELGALQYSSSAFFGEDPTVVLAVYQMPGSNALDLQQRVKDKMQELSARFPKGVSYAMHYDTTRFVSASMHDVLVTLGEALVLVVAVVFIFLQSWRTTIIPTIAIPVSLVATLVVMYMFGFSLNMLSLLGMVLAIGLVVDDAIVVVENVERQLEAGLKPLAATRAAMAEVTGPIIATTAVLMAVFVPVAFIPGVSGRLYNQFALTVAISFGISAFVSLTLTPALSAAFLRHRPATQFVLFRWFNTGFDRLSHAYANGVRFLIRLRWIMLGIFAAGLVATYFVWQRLPSTFLPVEDQGYFFVVIQLPDGASLERTDAVARKARDILQNTPGVDIVGSISGLNFLTSAAQSNSAVEFAILKPWDQRGPDQSASKLVADVRSKLMELPEAFALSFDPPSIPGIGTTGGFEFQVEDLTGRGSAALNDATQAVLAEARKQPELNPQQLFSSFSTSTPQFNYDLDRNKAKLLGLSLPDVFNTLQIYLGSLYVNDFNLFGRTFRVTIQADKDARAGAADISRLYVRNASGGMVPLSTLGKLVPIVGPETVPHYNNNASALINGGAAPGFSSGQAVAAMERAAATALPKDFGYEWTGITYQELKAGSIASIVFGLAMVFVFLILAAQYESWAMPFMVLLAVPLALFGAFVALLMRGMQIDVYSQIGFVMLIGLAAKNAILIVEFARRRREEGLSIVDAAMEAARLRLRPILMTAFAFILGVLPLMFSTGAGAASRQSIGTTVFGGMVAATILSLVFVPVFYAVIEQLRERGSKSEPVAEPTEPTAEPAFERLAEAAE
ncbi:MULTISPECIES: multidrug efflux RND transporter permease subunit [Mesorhizobium]|jgi:hydrophobe/amphiphile efflux-1 (HAE1) family protein|uniref:efflux RND transporter permease subunit n=1 Tax=Mesorhizobium TaxID=68287 RepID=UPI000482B4AA|nr:MULTISPECIES: multidrug efflux RND transporter permease subunit [Mesorhizobium]MCF6117842.1 multidrug efflux RND transporter permease subunit [Mesorhizobium muleiense]RWB07405.1 MAG: multidrug efflux RND transporter permease subunit [Mesorhizobium sp.]RWC06182.1 MAG: multidrug efflux RND transporter permease subunit [Mesorhizobium sp.]RWP09057.1 MAG: multidrug efflux RND transporter permease subunit [Mesorhizobium sp.]RWP25446.1 MAG: multidrug efflux RND transporter permease subunit [Mesorh